MCARIEKIRENLNCIEHLLMGWNESHPYCISLKCQRYMTFTPPYQQILTDISMFAVFFYEDLMFYGKHIPTPTVGTIHSHITDSKLH